MKCPDPRGCERCEQRQAANGEYREHESKLERLLGPEQEKPGYRDAQGSERVASSARTSGCAGNTEHHE